MQLLWEFWRNRSQNRRRLQLFGNWLMIWSLTQHYSYFDLFRRCRGDCCWWNLWVNVYFESIWAFYFYNFLWWEEFWKSRKCCWCRIWLYWLYFMLYMDAVLLMKIVRFLNLKWVNFGPTLPILASCECIGG